MMPRSSSSSWACSASLTNSLPGCPEEHIRKVPIVVPVLISSCQVSLKPKIGPEVSHGRISAPDSRSAWACPTARPSRRKGQSSTAIGACRGQQDRRTRPLALGRICPGCRRRPEEGAIRSRDRYLRHTHQVAAVYSAKSLRDFVPCTGHEPRGHHSRRRWPPDVSARRPRADSGIAVRAKAPVGFSADSF